MKVPAGAVPEALRASESGTAETLRASVMEKICSRGGPGLGKWNGRGAPRSWPRVEGAPRRLALKRCRAHDNDSLRSSEWPLRGQLASLAKVGRSAASLKALRAAWRINGVEHTTMTRYARQDGRFAASSLRSPRLAAERPTRCAHQACPLRGQLQGAPRRLALKRCRARYNDSLRSSGWPLRGQRPT